MLTISPKQMQVFEEAAQERFRLSLAAWLRLRSVKARRMPDRELESLIRSEEARAAVYSLRTQRQVAKWCALALLTCAAFDAPAVVAAALDDPANGATAEDRLDRLMAAVAATAHNQGGTLS